MYCLWLVNEVKMTGYVIIAVPIVVVETLNNRFGYTSLRSIIYHDSNYFFGGGITFYVGDYLKRNDVA